MVSRDRAYGWAFFGGVLLVAVVVVSWYAPAGRAAVPFDVPVPPAPFGEYTPFVLVVGVMAGGWLVVRQLRSRNWKRAGTAADLAPEGGGLFGRTEFTGTVGGRSVRAFAHDRGGDDGSTRYTVVQADLPEPAEDGAIVGPTGDGGPEVEPFQLEDAADASNDGLAAVGGSQAAAEAVVSGRAREALLDVERPGQVFVGDASVAFEDLERSGIISGRNLDLRRSLEQKYDEGFDHAGEWTRETPSTVTHVTRGLVFDGDELRRQVEAVAAVADAFEDASGSRGA